MKSRIITGAILTLSVTVLLLFSRFEIVLNIAIAILSAMAIFELYRATSVVPKPIQYISYAVGFAVSLMPHKISEYVIFGLLVLSIGIFGYLMLRVRKMKSVNTLLSVITAMLIVAFFKTAVCIRSESDGLYLLASAVLIPVLTDTGAYFIGRGMGKHKLAPSISPNKTIEGSIGGTISTVLIAIGIAAVLDAFNIISVNYGWLLLYITVTSLIGQFGDLALSSVKRIVGIKDYGQLLPGHGGMLDRVDSIIFALPMTYLFASVIKIIP